MRKKKCIITGTRAEYGLLKSIIKKNKIRKRLNFTNNSNWNAFITRIWINL